MRAHEAWDALPLPWRICLEEAWASWRAGSAGVGAVIVDEAEDVVAVGRNRMIERPEEPGVLAGTFMAHAEMNALAQLPLGDTARFTLYTTYEPCFMCASAILASRIPRVHYGAADPFFDGAHDWFATLPFAAYEVPERDCLGGAFGAFCHVLHLSWLAFWMNEGPVLDAHRRLAPAHLELATMTVTERLAVVAHDDGDVVTAASAVWEELQGLARA